MTEYEGDLDPFVVVAQIPDDLPVLLSKFVNPFTGRKNPGHILVPKIGIHNKTVLIEFNRVSVYLDRTHVTISSI